MIKSMWHTAVGIKNSKQLFSLRLAFTTQKQTTHTAEMMSVLCVAIFWVVNASSGEKSCLQFSIPTGSRAGGEGAVSHRLNTVRQLMHNIRLFYGTQSSAASSWRQAWTKNFRTTDEADTAHVVSELPTARKPWLYLFSRLRSNHHITCVQCQRATLPILNHMPQMFSLLPVFRPVLSKGASKAKIVWHLSVLI